MNSRPRALFLCWQSPGNRAIYPIGRLLRTEERKLYEFCYVSGVKDAEAQGFAPFREMPEIQAVYWFAQLPPVFANRVMSPSRPDYGNHLKRLGLADDGSAAQEPESILARSSGRKVTDHLEVTASPAFDPATRCWVYHGFARGVRHVLGAEEAILGVRHGDRLQIERDIANSWDARALLVLRLDRCKLGFVPHVLVEDLGWFVDQGVAVETEVIRVNLPPAPVHQRLLVAFKAEHRQGFAPMSTPRFQPLAEAATLLDLAAAADLNPA